MLCRQKAVSRHRRAPHFRPRTVRHSALLLEWRVCGAAVAGTAKGSSEAGVSVAAGRGRVRGLQSSGAAEVDTQHGATVPRVRMSMCGAHLLHEALASLPDGPASRNNDARVRASFHNAAQTHSPCASSHAPAECSTGGAAHMPNQTPVCRRSSLAPGSSTSWPSSWASRPPPPRQSHHRRRRPGERESQRGSGGSGKNENRRPQPPPSRRCAHTSSSYSSSSSSSSSNASASAAFLVATRLRLWWRARRSSQRRVSAHTLRRTTRTGTSSSPSSSSSSPSSPSSASPSSGSSPSCGVGGWWSGAGDGTPQARTGACVPPGGAQGAGRHFVPCPLVRNLLTSTSSTSSSSASPRPGGTGRSPEPHESDWRAVGVADRGERGWVLRGAIPSCHAPAAAAQGARRPAQRSLETQLPARHCPRASGAYTAARRAARLPLPSLPVFAAAPASRVPQPRQPRRLAPCATGVHAPMPMMSDLACWCVCLAGAVPGGRRRGRVRGASRVGLVAAVSPWLSQAPARRRAGTGGLAGARRRAVKRTWRAPTCDATCHVIAAAPETRRRRDAVCSHAWRLAAHGAAGGGHAR